MFSPPLAPSACLRLAFVVLFALASAAVDARAAGATRHAFDMRAGAASESLREFSAQSGEQILFSDSAVAGVATPAIKGTLTSQEALDRLLRGTGLVAMRDPATGAFAVRRETDAEKNVERAAPTPSDRPSPIRSESAGLRADEDGIVFGRVSNQGTKAYLEGAVVRVAGSNRSAVTENDGYYRLQLRPGTHTLVVSYTGLDTQTAEVVVTGGGNTGRDFGLTTEIYQLASVVVAGEPEGNALALTLQRQAPNVKNVVSADAFGSLAGNPADLLERIPGITSDRVGGDVRFLQIRGVDGDLNSVQLNGNRIASTGADGRGFQFQNIGSDHIESMEVVKAPTPDIDADSIGGSINFRSRSAFDLTGRRITYSLGGIIGYNRDTPHFAGTVSYSDVVDAFGGKRNLGISASAGYRQHRASIDNVRQDYQRVDTSPAFRWRTEVRDFTNIRSRYGGGVKIDYKLSEDSSLFANFNLSPHAEKGPSMTMVLSTALTVAQISPATGLPTGTGTILPGFTDERTEVRPLTTSFLQLINLMHDRNAFSGSGQVGGRIRKPTWNLDYDLSYSYARNELWNYQSTLTLRGLGWVTDSAGVDRWSPRVTFTAGPDTFNLDNYRENILTHLETPIQNEIRGAQVNYRRQFDLAAPASLKTGFKYREEIQERWNANRRWSYVGPDGVMGSADDRLSQFRDFDYNYGPVDGFYPARPFVSTAAMVEDLHAHPELWSEDVAYRVQQTLTGRRSLKEEVAAAYLQGTVDLGAVSILGGVRVEETNVSGTGSVRNLTPVEIARRAAWVGPVTVEETVRRNTAEYGGRRTSTRDYRNVFPGIHFRAEPIDRLVFRASYSNGIGRPAFTAITPNDTVFEDSRIVQASNPGLNPQYSQNFDAGAEYYFNPAGVVSFGVFLKEIRDFIYNSAGTIIPGGADNGFNGEYEGYELRTQANGGFAKVRGFEANYQQQFRFLPGWMKGLGFFANYTRLATEGDYGDLGNVQRTGELAGFKPRAANVGLSYIRGRLNLRVNYGYNGRMLSTANAQNNLKIYRLPEQRVDLKCKFILSRNLDLYLDVYNIFNDKQELEYGALNRPRQSNDRHDPQFHLGVNGRL